MQYSGTDFVPVFGNRIAGHILKTEVSGGGSRFWEPEWYSIRVLVFCGSATLFLTGTRRRQMIFCGGGGGEKAMPFRSSLPSWHCSWAWHEFCCRLGAATSPFEFLGWVLRLCVLERCHVDAARVLANVFS